MQRQTAVTAYLESKQLPLFAFARRYSDKYISMTRLSNNMIVTAIMHDWIIALPGTDAHMFYIYDWRTTCLYVPP